MRDPRPKDRAYCGTAVIYDEQPTAFRQSWDQRMRWTKGFYQIDARYTGALLGGCLRGGRHSMSCYDMLMTVAPATCHARRAGAGAVRLSEQPCAAGVYHIPRAAYAGADYLDDN